MQKNKKPKFLYDYKYELECGSVFYNVYSKGNCFKVEVLVHDNGNICSPDRFQVTTDSHPYPGARAGDFPNKSIPEELEARAATLLAVLEATPPEQRTTLSWIAPDNERSSDLEAEADPEKIARREKATRMMEEREARIARARGMDRDRDDGPER